MTGAAAEHPSFAAVPGLGGGALQPTQQAILRQTFPPHAQGIAMAMFAMVVTIGPAIGPVLGGYITDNYSWPWIFYINPPRRRGRHHDDGPERPRAPGRASPTASAPSWRASTSISPASP
jgi:hypothetical protein